MSIVQVNRPEQKSMIGIPVFIASSLFVPFFWKGLRIEHVLWWGLGVAFLGIIVILNPGGNFFQFASLLALISEIIGSIAFVSMRYSHFSVEPEAMLFYLFLLNTIFSGIVTLISFETSWEALTLQNLGLMALVGIFGLLYQVFSTLGSRYVPLRLGSIFIILLDEWIWKATIPMSMYVSFGLIVLGAALLVMLYPKDDYKIKEKK